MYYEIFTEKNIKINKEDIDKIIKKFVKLFKIPSKTYLSIAFVLPKTIKILNYKYRRENKVTDVLSFSNPSFLPFKKQINNKRNVKDKINRKQFFSDESFIGEIIICYEQACIQSKKYGKKISEETCRLLTHALVHLMGYDHKTTKDEKNMVKKEKEILGIKSIYD